MSNVKTQMPNEIQISNVKILGSTRVFIPFDVMDDSLADESIFAAEFRIKIFLCFGLCHLFELWILAFVIFSLILKSLPTRPPVLGRASAPGRLALLGWRANYRF